MDEDPFAFPAIRDPLPAAVARGKGAIHGAMLPLNHPAFLAEPQQVRLHSGPRPTGVPALRPPMGSALEGPLGPAWEVTPVGEIHLL